MRNIKFCWWLLTVIQKATLSTHNISLCYLKRQRQFCLTFGCCLIVCTLTQINTGSLNATSKDRKINSQGKEKKVLTYRNNLKLFPTKLNYCQNFVPKGQMQFFNDEGFVYSVDRNKWRVWDIKSRCFNKYKDWSHNLYSTTLVLSWKYTIRF